MGYHRLSKFLEKKVPIVEIYTNFATFQESEEKAELHEKRLLITF